MIQNGILSNNIDSTYNIILFAQTHGGADSAANISKLKLYYFNLFYNNNIIRKMIPALRNSDNVAGLYDLVNNEFYTNAGTGTFITGPKIGGTTANVKIYKETNALEANEFWEI